VLARYNDVGSFHSGLVSSHGLTPGQDGGLGCERFCQVDDNVSVKQRITEWNEGRSYIYEVFEWENIPLKEMTVTYSVQESETGETQISQLMDFQLSNPMFEMIAAGKLQEGITDSLLIFRHYIETGQSRVPIDEVRESYADS
jgi:hypothetical protein